MVCMETTDTSIEHYGDGSFLGAEAAQGRPPKVRLSVIGKCIHDWRRNYNLGGRDAIGHSGQCIVDAAWRRRAQAEHLEQAKVLRFAWVMCMFSAMLNDSQGRGTLKRASNQNGSTVKIPTSAVTA
jgi:hypothetical protein